MKISDSTRLLQAAREVVRAQQVHAQANETNDLHQMVNACGVRDTAIEALAAVVAEVELSS